MKGPATRFLGSQLAWGLWSYFSNQKSGPSRLIVPEKLGPEAAASGVPARYAGQRQGGNSDLGWGERGFAAPDGAGTVTVCWVPGPLRPAGLQPAARDPLVPAGGPSVALCSTQRLCQALPAKSSQP